MEILQHVLVMILAVTLIGAFGKRVPIPLPLLLVGGGAALSVSFEFGKVELEPEIFFSLFIPPLLFADSWLLPKREFYQLRYSIMLLAFGRSLLRCLPSGMDCIFSFLVCHSPPALRSVP